MATMGEKQLPLSGSRSLLKQLRPKGSSKGLLPRAMPGRSDSSSADEREGNASEDASTRSSNDSRSSSDADPDRSTTAPAPKPSPFRSMLGGGGVSGTLALTGRLGRLRKLDSMQDKASSGVLRREGSGLVQRLGRGKKLRGGGKARPPVQHSESLSSSEGTQGSSERDMNMASGDDVMSPASSNGQGFLSSPGRMTTSSSDDDTELDSPRRKTNTRNGGSGGVSHSESLLSAGKTVSHASQLKRGLLRLTGRTPRQPPVPRVSTSSNSRSATSEEEGGGDQEDLTEFATSPGRSLATPESSLLDSNLGKKGLLARGGAPRRGLGRTNQDEASSPGQPRTTVSRGGGGGSTTGRSSRSGVESPHRRHGSGVPSWRRLVGGLGGWGSLDDAGEHEVAPVSGVGRPAAGMMENAMYGWFGGVVGRTWPRAGLALRPVVNDEDAKQIRARVKPRNAAAEEDVIRVHVISADALPEDSRITRPMVIVHIVDSSTGRYLSRRPLPKASAAAGGGAEFSPRQFSRDGAGGEVGQTRGHPLPPAGKPQQQRERRGKSEKEDPAGAHEPVEVGGATTTFEERTVWDLTASDRPKTGRAFGTVPPAATQPWLMTMQSSTPVWEEALVFAESYRRLLAPESLVLFELVDFAMTLSRKEARKGGGLVKIAWAFLKPVGARGECNVGVRNGDHFPPSSSSSQEDSGGGECTRRSRLQLFQHQPLSMLARWQARREGFPRLPPPAAPDVPDVFLQFLLPGRSRPYPATLAVSVGPTSRPRPVLVARRPKASHEREHHNLSYEALAAMHQRSREDRENDEAAGLLPAGGRSGSGGGGGGGGGGMGPSAAAVARTRRLRDKNEPCVLPDRLLHRVYAGQNGAMTLAFSGSGALLAAACCDDPLPGRFPIRLIDPETGRCRHELGGHASMVYSLVWSPGDSFLLSASADGTAKVWRISALSNAGGVGNAGSHPSEGAPACAEGLLATATRGGKDDGPRLACVLQHAPPCFVYAAVFQPAEVMDRTRGTTVTALDNQSPASEASECALVVTGAYDRRLRLWDTTAAVAAPARGGGRAKMLGTLSSKMVHESHVNAIVYDSRNSRLYSGDGAGVIVVWRRGGGGSQKGVEDYGILRKVQHADLLGKAITSLALAPRLRRGQLLVQAHGNTLRLLDLGTYRLVNPGFAGGATAESLIRASFSPDGRFVVSGSETGRVRVWEAQEGKRVKTPLQTLGTACCLRGVAWHPNQHVVALAGHGQDAPVLLYCGEARADKQAKGVLETCVSSSAMQEQAAREAQASAEEHRRRLENRQRLRELRIRRLRAKALGQTDGPLATAKGQDGSGPESGIVAALAALTAGGNQQR
ncbi:unnamed protein product [Ectocarpus fasciculatus]